MQRVDFVVSGGEVVSTTVDIVQRNPVLNMLWQHALTDPDKPIVLKDDRKTFDALLRHLAGEQVNLANIGLTDLIALFRCAHSYQCYDLGSHILLELESYRSPESVLRIYRVLQPLPERPEVGDPSAPSAPPETDLRDIDPEQAGFSSLLDRNFQRCLEVIDSRSSEVFTSDALLLLLPYQLLELAQRDTLQAREPEVGRGLLRWVGHHTFNAQLAPEERRLLVLGSLRLLLMTPKEIKKLDLEREGVLTLQELEAVLRIAHHGSGELPDHLEPYREYWQCRRTSDKTSRGILRRLMERTRPAGAHSGQVLLDSAERREAAIQKRSRRADKLKMALATGASFIFD